MPFDKSKPAILLDLDQTVISAEAHDDDKYNEYKKTHEDKLKKFTSYEMEDYYTVYERPGLQPFLDFLFANFNVSVWTAATKDYALFIIEKILLQNKPGRKLDYIFFSYHCKISEKKKSGTKDLSILWDVYGLSDYSKNNTVILDDYDEVYNTQKDNCIIAIPFMVTEEASEKDKFLKQLIPKLKKMISHIQSGKENPARIVNK